MGTKREVLAQALEEARVLGVLGLVRSRPVKQWALKCKNSCPVYEPGTPSYCTPDRKIPKADAIRLVCAGKAIKIKANKAIRLTAKRKPRVRRTPKSVGVSSLYMTKREGRYSECQGGLVSPK